MKRPSVHLALFIVALWAPLLSAQEMGEARWESSVDWQEGTLELVATMEIDRDGPNAPAAQHRAEQRIRTALPGELVRALLPLRIDSRNTLADALAEEPSLYQAIADLAREADRVTTRPDRSLASVEVHYRLDLYPDLTEILAVDEPPIPFRRVLGWVPTTDYTGVVIYAADPLPLHGTTLTTTIVPALFPEIFDAGMEQVLSRDQIDPQWLARWGSAAYTDSLDLSPFVDRIGENPKRLVATRLFGIVPTDLVIRSADARELLSREENRRLLREGRIVIVTAPATD